MSMYGRLCIVVCARRYQRETGLGAGLHRRRLSNRESRTVAKKSIKLVMAYRSCHCLTTTIFLFSHCKKIKLYLGEFSLYNGLADRSMLPGSPSLWKTVKINGQRWWTTFDSTKKRKDEISSAMVGRLESRYKWSEIFNLNLATFVTKSEPQINDLRSVC